MARSNEQISGQEFNELRNHLADETWRVYNPDRGWQTARWDEIFGAYPKAVQQEICGLQQKTRNAIESNIFRRMGLSPDLYTSFTQEKMQEKIKTAAETERKRIEQEEGWGAIRKTANWFHRKIHTGLGRNLDEDEYFRGRDINEKRTNLINDIQNITLGPNPQQVRAFNALGLEVNIDFMPGITTIEALGAGGTAQDIDFIASSLDDIRLQLRLTGQYDQIASQPGYQRFEVLKKRLVELNDSEAEIYQENIATSIFDPQRIRVLWDSNQYNIRTDIEGILDSTHNFDDTAVQALIMRLQTDWARSNYEPAMQDRLRARRTRMMAILGQGNAELIEQKRNIEDLTKTITSLEATNNSGLDILFGGIPNIARDVIDLTDVNNFEIWPTMNPAVPTPPHPPPGPPIGSPPGTRFTNIQGQIDFYQNAGAYLDNIPVAGLGVSAVNKINEQKRDYNTCLRESKEKQKQIGAKETELRDKAGQLVEIFTVQFREEFSQPPPVPPLVPFRAGTNLLTLETAVTAVAGGGPVRTLATVINTAGFWDNLRHEISNTRGGLANEENYRRRMSIYLERQREEKKRLELQRDRLQKTVDEAGRGPYEARDLLLAYEKACLEDRGIIDETLRDEQASMSVDKLLLEADKAKNFIPYLNEELGQYISKSWFRKQLNRLDFSTWDEDQIMSLLTRYSATHRKLFKNITSSSEVQEIISVMNKEGLSYGDIKPIWETIYDILRNKKIKGVDETIEIEDKAYRPLQLLVERLQDAYLHKKRDDLREKIANKELKELEGKSDAAKLIAALKLQDKDEVEARKKFDGNLKRLGETVGDVWKWLRQGKTEKADLKDIAKRAEEGKLKDDDKKVIASMLNVEEKDIPSDFKKIFDRFDSGWSLQKILYYKELFDILKGGMDYLGVTGSKSVTVGSGLLKRGVAKGADLGIGAAGWLWGLGGKPAGRILNAGRTGLNVAKKTASVATYPVRHPINTALLAAYPILHPWKSTKGIGKAGWWTTKAALKCCKLPFSTIAAARRVHA